jgi:hypothetical protein
MFVFFAVLVGGAITGLLWASRLGEAPRPSGDVLEGLRPRHRRLPYELAELGDMDWTVTRPPVPGMFH